jgi:hypothetical protein
MKLSLGRKLMDEMAILLSFIFIRIQCTFNHFIYVANGDLVCHQNRESS